MLHSLYDILSHNDKTRKNRISLSVRPLGQENCWVSGINMVCSYLVSPGDSGRFESSKLKWQFQEQQTKQKAYCDSTLVIYTHKDTYATLPTAAAVFDVGRLVQSPIAKTLGYFLCCRVSLSTSTQPFSSETGLLMSTAGGPIGGVTWSISY